MIQQGDTETNVLASAKEAKDFANKILEAVKNTYDGCQHVHGVFEQSKFKGPWRIVLHIMAEDE